MAPAQSYLDITRSRFSRFVNLTDPTRGWHDDFSYFGANVYAYLLARFEDYIDLISMQFYESYSQAACAVRHRSITPHDYLIQYIQGLKSAGEAFFVDFSDDTSVNMPSQLVRLPLSKLLLGFANGWAHDSPKALLIYSTEVKAAYTSLMAAGHNLPRGIMFWTIDEEGNHDIFLTPGLNDILQIRSKQDAEVASA
jgi:beta-glucosidase